MIDPWPRRRHRARRPTTGRRSRPSPTSGAAGRICSRRRRCAAWRSAVSLRLAARDRPRRGRVRRSTRALALRELVLRPHADPLGRSLDRRERRTGCRSSLLVTVLVFWQAGLYAQRERRAGFGRIVSSLVVVALLVLAFGARHRPRLHDLRPDPDRARAHGRADRRSSARATTRQPARRSTSSACAAARSSSARASTSTHLLRDARLRPRRHRLRVRRRRQPEPIDGRDLPRARRARGAARGARRAPGRRADRHRLGLHRARAARRSSSTRTARGVKVRIAPKTTELLVAARRVRPGPGRAAVRAAPAGVRRHRLGGEARRSTWSSAGRDRARAAALARDRRGDQAHLARAGLLPRSAHRARRARRSGCSSSGRWSRARPTQQAELEHAERGRGRAVQDPRRPARDGGRPRAAAASRSTSCRTCSTCCAAR